MSDLFIGPSNPINAIRSILQTKLRQPPKQFLKKAIVLDVDVNGNTFFDKCPRNSIKYQLDEQSDIDEDGILDNVQGIAIAFQDYPIKPAEEVYIMFIDEAMQQAFWLPIKNFPMSPEIETYNNKKIQSRVFKNIDDELDPLSAIIEDDIPKMKLRLGDRILEGGNNAIVYISRDRPSDAGSGYKEKAGLVFIASGRVGEDIDLKNDESYIYCCQLSDVDDDLGDDEDPRSKTPTIIIKSKNIRVPFEEDLRIYNNNFKATIKDDGSLELKNNSNAKIYLDKDGNLTFENIKNVKIKNTDSIELGSSQKSLTTFEDLQSYTKQLEGAIQAAKYTTPAGAAEPLTFIAPGGLQNTASTKNTKTKLTI